MMLTNKILMLIQVFRLSGYGSGVCEGNESTTKSSTTVDILLPFATILTRRHGKL